MDFIYGLYIWIIYRDYIKIIYRDYATHLAMIILPSFFGDYIGIV